MEITDEMVERAAQVMASMLGDMGGTIGRDVFRAGVRRALTAALAPEVSVPADVLARWAREVTDEEGLDPLAAELRSWLGKAR